MRSNGRTLLEAVPDLLLSLGPGGDVVDVKVPPRFPITLDAPEQLKGQQLRDVLPSRLASACTTHIERLLGGIEPSLEFDYHLNSQHSLVVRVLPAGDGAVLIAVRDGTKRRRATDRLRLEATLFEHTREGVLVADADWCVQAVNDAFTRITGYSPSEVKGRNPDDFLRSGRHPDTFFDDVNSELGRKGYWQGEIWNRHKSGEIHPMWVTVVVKHDARDKVTHYVQTVTDLTGRDGIEDRLKYLTHYDALTNLPNRNLVLDRLEHSLAWAERRGNRVAVLCIDMDRFRSVNEHRGQNIGDALLWQVAERLKAVARKTDTVARFGGDEFLVVGQDLATGDQARRMAVRILETLSEPFVVEGERFDLTVSIGVSVFPDDSREAEPLVRNAVAAVAQARAQGGKGFSFFSEEMTVEAHERHHLEQALREAIERSEFCLYYQPKIDLTSGRVPGTEALIRWEHPTRGLVPPLSFIPLAEETGLIVQIGDWVLQTACMQTAEWHKKGFDWLQVAVNLSPTQLWDVDLIDKVVSALEKSGLGPQHLELEITESHIVADPQKAVKILKDLKALGVSFSIDDFGTGYSSLSMLRSLPVDTLKIDKSFVDDIPHDSDDRAIVSAIITMGHSLRMHVVAEGVETAEQLRILREQSCDQLQGYFFSRPLPPEALEAYLRSFVPPA